MKKNTNTLLNEELHSYERWKVYTNKNSSLSNNNTGCTEMNPQNNSSKLRIQAREVETI